MAVNNNATPKTSTRVSSTSVDGLQHDNNTMAVLEFTSNRSGQQLTYEDPFATFYPSYYNLAYEIEGDTDSNEVRSYPSWFELNQSYYTFPANLTPSDGWYGGDTITLDNGIYEFNIFCVTQSRQYNASSYATNFMEAPALQHWFTGVEDFAGDLSDQEGWYDNAYLTLLHEQDIDSEKIKQWHGKFTFSFSDKIGSKAHFRLRLDALNGGTTFTDQAFCKAELFAGGLNFRNFTGNTTGIISYNYAFRTLVEVKRISGKADSAWDYYHI